MRAFKMGYPAAYNNSSLDLQADWANSKMVTKIIYF